MCVRLCLSVIDSTNWYKNKYWYFCLEIWILAWRSHGKIMELFSEIFVGTLSSVHPISTSPASRSQARFLYHPHPCTVSPASRSLDSNLSSIHVTPHLHPGPELGVLPQSKSRITFIYVMRIAPQFHTSPFPICPGLKIYSSTESKSHFTPMKVLRFASYLNLGS